MQKCTTNHPAIVLGMYETGLGVGRCLARHGINVIGMDFKRDIGFRSRFIKAHICPHPLQNMDGFLNFLTEYSKKCAFKPVLFITADEFVLSVSRMRKKLSNYFLFNLPSEGTIELIMNKKNLYEEAENIGISVPKTYCVRSIAELCNVQNNFEFPVFLKPSYSYEWRKHFGGTKGFFIKTDTELFEKIKIASEKKISVIIQEVIQGPDTHHYKYCCYLSRNGELLLAFTLRKIRQQPVRFGIGSMVESVNYPSLSRIGENLFTSLEYRGVGSAEFKLDEKDNRLKLIEINPRYWQQNTLANRCGMNFALIDYLEATGQKPAPIYDFLKNVKWVNIYMDFNASLSYWKQKSLSLTDWLNTWRGVKILSDFAYDDIGPAVFEANYWRILLRIWKYICRKVIRLFHE